MIQKKLWDGALWSPSYFAGGCGGAPIAVIRKYIEQQQTPIKSKMQGKEGFAISAIHLHHLASAVVSMVKGRGFTRKSDKLLNCT